MRDFRWTAVGRTLRAIARAGAARTAATIAGVGPSVTPEFFAARYR